MLGEVRGLGKLNVVLSTRNSWARERRGDECLNLLLGSWGVVPEVLEISQLGHDVAEHLVEPRWRSSRTEACVHTWPASGLATRLGPGAWRPGGGWGGG